MRVLLVEDEPHAAHVLAKGLREQTYAVDLAEDGDGAIFQIGTTDYDAVILDVMLPGRDGFAVCRNIRESGCTVPILMVTARDAVEARIEGLDSGADDYLLTVRFRELLARLRALIRRGRQPLLPGVSQWDLCSTRAAGAGPQSCGPHRQGVCVAQYWRGAPGDGRADIASTSGTSTRSVSNIVDVCSGCVASWTRRGRRP